MGLTKLKNNSADLSRLRTDKQRKWLLHYVLLRAQGKDSPKQAAIDAGYSVKVAANIGYRLLKNPIVQAYLGKIERLDVERLELDRGEALKQLYYALTRQVKDFCDNRGMPLPPNMLPERCQSIVDGYKVKVLRTRRVGADGEEEYAEELVEVEYKLTPHATAREQAMKHKGLFADVVPEPEDVESVWDRLSGEARTVNPVTKRLQIEQERNDEK